MKATARSIRGDGTPSGSNGDNGTLLTSINDILQLNEALIYVSRHLEVCIGSIFKVDSLNYPSWGFEATPDNIDQIKYWIDFYYGKDYSERRRNGAAESVLKSDFKVTQEKRMAEFIAVTVREMMRSMDDGHREFHVCDIPARDGYLSAAIAHALRRDSDTESLLPRTMFHLVDLSGQKLDRADVTLAQFGARTEKYMAKDEFFLRQAQAGSYDIMVTLGHLHHKPFLVEFLKEMNRVLSDDGSLVIADWHSPLCSHPAYVLALLKNLGLELSRLDAFREVMGKQLATPRTPLSIAETNSLMNHMAHWKSVMRRLRENPPNVMPRLYINAAYDTSIQRQKKLEEADFSVNVADVRKAFPRARLPQFSTSTPSLAAKRLVADSDSATVMAAVKKR